MSISMPQTEVDDYSEQFSCILHDMGKAARAIIIHGNKTLVMHRNKHGSQYFTLVGGRANEDEAPEQTLAREVHEETGLVVTKSQFVFYEGHPEPYNEQFVFLCEVSNPEAMAMQEWSEEGTMNRYGANTHTPMWVNIDAFERLPFRTPQLQEAIMKGFKKGFPETAIRL
jgi:ADP-ribose pyrophosphatase YjhB (NUDIX family)